jgi:predicted nucleic acid-binding protein
VKPILVDSNVLLDVATMDPRWSRWSVRAPEEAANEAPLIINPLVFAEVSIRYSRIEDLESALPSDLYRREPLPFAAAFLAGKAFLTYRRRGGSRTSPLPEFYIGAHAAVADLRLLTRDAGRYRTHFPTVELISPT